MQQPELIPPLLLLPPAAPTAGTSETVRVSLMHQNHKKSYELILRTGQILSFSVFRNPYSVLRTRFLKIDAFLSQRDPKRQVNVIRLKDKNNKIEKKHPWLQGPPLARPAKLAVTSQQAQRDRVVAT